MRDQDDVYAIEFALDFARRYCPAADDAGPAGPSMGLGHATDGRQAVLGQPGADLTPYIVVGAVTFIYHDAGAAPTGQFA